VTHAVVAPRLSGSRPRRFVMADMAFALLLIGGFIVVLLTLRGLRRR
jgi:hypothetical protein